MKLWRKMLEAQQELSAVPLKEELEPSRVALWGPSEVLLEAPSLMGFYVLVLCLEMDRGTR